MAEEYQCASCDGLITDEPIWINPLAADPASIGSGSNSLGPCIGDSSSGGGFAPYHRECAIERWPDLKDRITRSN